MFKTVERPIFSSIQQALFPIYFGIQTAAPVLMALTFPGNALFGLSSGVQGLFNQSQRYQSLLPIGIMFVTGATNLFVLLPMVTGVMKERRGQGKPLNVIVDCVDAQLTTISQAGRQGVGCCRPALR
jgi:hypothetical protein